MKAKLEIEEFKQRFRDRGFEENQISEIIEEFVNGIDISLQPGSFEFHAGDHCKIYMLNKKGEFSSGDEIIPCHNFVTSIEGIEDAQITSIEIPKLDMRSKDVFTLSLNFMPFKLSNLFSNQSNKSDKQEIVWED